MNGVLEPDSSGGSFVARPLHGRAFGKYADRYKLLPEIHEIEGKSFGKIVGELYERYMASPAKSELDAVVV